MKPYPEYKPTGLAWLPEIPRHWKCAKIRELFTERIQKVSDKEFAPLSVSKGGIVPQIATVAKTDNGDNRKRVKVGDFVINSRSDRKGSSGISAYDGSVSLINIVLNPRAKENGRFLHYLLKSIPFTEEYYRNGRGIVADLWTTRYSEMKTISVPVPPADEQAQIVRYLDAMTAKINKLIRAKKRQIALLQEQKQAIINQAVTRGLDPDVELKDSGIDWLGPIPKQWEIMTMSRLSQTVRGASPRPAGDFRFFGGNTIPWITVSELTKDESKYIKKTATYLTEEGQKQSRTINSDTLLLSNSGATLGVPKISHIMGCINDGVVAFLSPKEDIEFLYYALKNQTINLRKIVEGYGQPNLNTTIVKNIIVAIPPLNIQHDIVEYLDKKCSDINFIIEQYQKIIEQYFEYKNSLIAAVVTGQVDVRNIAVEAVSPEDLAPSDDPDESEEQDSLRPEESEE